MIYRLLKKKANNELRDSWSNKFRLKRFAKFEKFINSIPKPIKILDVGGTINYWEQMNFVKNSDIYFTILNLEKEKIQYKNFISKIGDARDLSEFKDKQFDIVFSNSVIEHVGSFEDQQKMAREIKRVGEHYYIQTPNFYFPIEPHYLFPFFQILPLFMQIFLLMHIPLGLLESALTDKEEARKAALSIRLLTYRELKKLFPGAIILKEKFMGLNKSFVVLSK